MQVFESHKESHPHMAHAEVYFMDHLFNMVANASLDLHLKYDSLDGTNEFSADHLDGAEEAIALKKYEINTTKHTYSPGAYGIKTDSCLNHSPTFPFLHKDVQEFYQSYHHM